MSPHIRSIAFSVLVTLCAVTARAQWVQLGPSGAAGSVSSLLKSDAGIFAASPGGGISRSTDGGLSWHTTNTGLTNLNVTALAAIGGMVFAATSGDGIFASTDGGESWSPRGLLISDHVNSLEAVGTTLFTGPGTYGAFFSSDNGVTWNPAGKGLALEAVQRFFAGDSTIFAGTASKGVYVTTDGGRKWAPSNTGLTSLAVDAFAVAVGPGSFTGLRVGLSTVQGLALAAGRPCLGACVLDVLALASPGTPTMALGDAFRGEVYWASYDGEGRPTGPPQVGPIADALAQATQETAFVGDAAATHRAAITDRFPRAGFPRFPTFLAATLGLWAEPRLRAGQGSGAESLRPLYVRAAEFRKASA